MALRRLFDEHGDPVDLEIEDATDDGKEPSNSDWAKLRQATRAREKAEQDLAAQRKENAFLRIGVDMNDPRVSDFYKAYDEDLAPDAIKAAATARGYLENGQQPGDTPGQALDSSGQAADLAAHQANARISSASAGSTPDLRSDLAKLGDAAEQGGQAGIEDFLRERGFAVIQEGQS